MLKLRPTGAGLVCTEFPCPGFIDLHAELGAPLDHALTELHMQTKKIKAIIEKFILFCNLYVGLIV